MSGSHDVMGRKRVISQCGTITEVLDIYTTTKAMLVHRGMHQMKRRHHLNGNRLKAAARTFNDGPGNPLRVNEGGNPPTAVTLIDGLHSMYVHTTMNVIDC